MIKIREVTSKQTVLNVDDETGYLGRIKFSKYNDQWCFGKLDCEKLISEEEMTAILAELKRLNKERNDG